MLWAQSTTNELISRSSICLLIIHSTSHNTFHIKIYKNPLSKHLAQTLLHHTSFFFFFLSTPTSLRKSKIASGTTFWKGEYKDFSSKCFFLTSTKSAHSIKVCCDYSITCNPKFVTAKIRSLLLRKSYRYVTAKSTHSYTGSDTYPRTHTYTGTHTYTESHTYQRYTIT